MTDPINVPVVACSSAVVDSANTLHARETARRVAEMQGRGKPLKYHNIRVSSRNEGEWEIFKLRWHRHTGEILD